jgi:hypothetical protein
MAVCCYESGLHLRSHYTLLTLTPSLEVTNQKIIRFSSEPSPLNPIASLVHHAILKSNINSDVHEYVAVFLSSYWTDPKGFRNP